MPKLHQVVGGVLFLWLWDLGQLASSWPTVKKLQQDGPMVWSTHPILPPGNTG